MLFNANRRHIIFEGCDGTGKDTLVSDLIKKGLVDKFQLHDRASTSLGGPHRELDAWVNTDLLDLVENPTNRFYMYNRHPLISETIYARWRHTRRGLHGKFRDRSWVMNSRALLSKYAILVICSPPPAVVKRNVASGRHMPGVAENWSHIYNEYQTFMWPGIVVRYDYTTSTPEELMTILNQYLETTR